MRWLAALSLLPSLALAQVPADAVLYRIDMTQSAWRTFGPGAPVATLAAQIAQESSWKINARSRVGAQGLAQFMPATAGDVGERWPDVCKPVNPFSATWAFACRDRYLKSLIDSLHNVYTSVCDDWAFGLKAYNGGRTWVNRDRLKARANGFNYNDWRVVAYFNAGRSRANFIENIEYPVRIFKREYRYADWGPGLNCPTELGT